MTIQDLGAIGEFLGLFAVLITLFYIAKQTHIGVELNRGKETRGLIDQFNGYLRRMTEPTYLDPVRNALVSYRQLDKDSQAHAFVIFVQWVNFYEQAMYAHQSGLVQEPVLHAFRAYVVAFLITPGGSEFWEDMKHVFGAEVSAQIDDFLKQEELPPPITDTYPWLQRVESG